VTESEDQREGIGRISNRSPYLEVNWLGTLEERGESDEDATRKLNAVDDERD
jgi:hypothetical protein